MTTESIPMFATLGHFIHDASLPRRTEVLGGLDLAAYRELWAARRLVEAVRLTLADAAWEADGVEDRSRAAVPKHHLVLLEAAIDVITNQRAATPDGFPHAGCEVGASGGCDAGFCPCHDGQRTPQPPLLDRAA